MSLLRMSLHGSAIIAFAMILRALARGRLPRRGFVALWLLAAARMLLPWKLPFRYGASALLARVPEAVRRVEPVMSAQNVSPQAPVTMVSAATAQVQFSAPSPWRVLWLLGLLACALALLLPHLRWKRIYARSLPLEDANVARWLDAHRTRRRVRVRVSDEIFTPLSYGVLRPVILLPASMDRSDAARLRCVLAHEMAHIRAFDTLAKLVLAAALCVHWFNPLAWMMYLLANRDMELACDSAALRDCGEGARRDYARALLELAARQSGLPSPLTNGFSRQTIEERIRAIMKMRPLKRFAALAMALLVALCALAFATSAEEETVAASAPNDRIEALMFDGWETLSLREYRGTLYARDPDPDALLLADDVWENGRYLDWLRFALDPMINGMWNDGPQGDMRYTIIESGGFGDAAGSEMSEYGFQLRCTALDLDTLTIGEYSEALRAVTEGMEDIFIGGATQEAVDARAAELTARYSDGERLAFEIEAEIGAPETNSSFRSDDSVTESEALLAELTFEGYEKMSVRAYREWLWATHDGEALGMRSWSLFSGEFIDYMDYVLHFMTQPDLQMEMYYPLPGIAAEDCMISVRILDPDALTVGELRDSCKAVVEGIQAETEAPGEEVAPEKLSEIAGAYLDRYNSDALAFGLITGGTWRDQVTQAQLEKYAALGLEYWYQGGQLRMAYQGRAVQSIYDPVTKIAIANSAGPEGLQGEGKLTVVYEDENPIELRFND